MTTPDAAISELVTEYGAAVRRTAFGVTRSDVAAQDVAQEVFLRAWNRGGFDPARGSMHGWLQVMTRNAAIDWVRSEQAHRRRTEEVGVLHTTASPSLEDEVADAGRAAEVRAAVAALPTEERDAVWLAYFGGLSYKQVAERLGLAEGTVKSQIRRALGRLAGVLAPKLATVA
jgi:RNA polymerase sigma-70 factor (ECF subfamily)